MGAQPRFPRSVDEGGAVPVPPRDPTIDALIRDPHLAEQVAAHDVPRLLACIGAAQAALGSVQATLLAKVLGPAVVGPPLPASDPVMPASSDRAGTRYMRTSELVERLGVCRATLWKWRRRGWFPEPVSLGPNVTAWPVEVIRAWEQQAAQRSSQWPGSGSV